MFDVINRLKELGLNVDACDPYVFDNDIVDKLVGVDQLPLNHYDGIFAAVRHEEFLKRGYA